MLSITLGWKKCFIYFMIRKWKILITNSQEYTHLSTTAYEKHGIKWDGKRLKRKAETTEKTCNNLQGS